MSPRHDGWGVTANDLLLELCNLAGIRNISIKVSAGWRDLRAQLAYYAAQFKAKLNTSEFLGCCMF
jgi:ribosomal protein S5